MIASSKRITKWAAVFIKYMELFSLQSIVNMKIFRFNLLALFNDCVYIFLVIKDALGGMCYLFHDQLRGGHSDTDSFLLQCTEHFCVVQITP